MADGVFDANPPAWAMQCDAASCAVESSVADPFALAEASRAAAAPLPAITGESDMNEEKETMPTDVTLPATINNNDNPSSSSSSFVPLADSADYIARLEHRLQRIKNQPILQQKERRVPGSEFFVSSSASSTSHGAAIRTHTFSSATTSWLGEDDDAEDAADDATTIGVGAIHSSEDEQEETHRERDNQQQTNSNAADIEEQMLLVSLLDQHNQLMPDADTLQMEQARSTPAADPPSQTASSSVSLTHSSMLPSASSFLAPPLSTSAPSMVGPSPSHMIETSDGSDTSSHTHVYNGGIATNGEPASTGGLAPVPRRQFYYSSQTCLAQALNWFEESESSCRIT